MALGFAACPLRRSALPHARASRTIPDACETEFCHPATGPCLTCPLRLAHAVLKCPSLVARDNPGSWTRASARLQLPLVLSWTCPCPCREATRRFNLLGVDECRICPFPAAEPNATTCPTCPCLVLQHQEELPFNATPWQTFPFRPGATHEGLLQEEAQALPDDRAKAGRKS